MRQKNKYIILIKLYLKIFLINFIIISFSINKIINYYNYNYNYNLDKFYKKPLNKKIKIGIVSISIKNGGIERSTSLILHYFNKVKIFKVFLFTHNKQNNEYFIDTNIKRIIFKNNLIEVLKKTKIDILIYQLYNYKEINKLNKINSYL